MTRFSRVARIGVLGGTVVSLASGSALVAGAALACAAGLGVWTWRRASSKEGLVFRVDRGELEIAPRGSTEILERIRLVDLSDVTLDTRCIRKVQPGPDAVPAVQFVNSIVGPELDVARIVLRVAARRDVIRLTDAFLPHMHSVEWAGKIRMFLRSHGWIPEDEWDERGRPAHDHDDDD